MLYMYISMSVYKIQFLYKSTVCYTSWYGWGFGMVNSHDVYRQSMKMKAKNKCNS